MFVGDILDNTIKLYYEGRKEEAVKILQDNFENIDDLSCIRFLSGKLFSGIIFLPDDGLFLVLGDDLMKLILGEYRQTFKYKGDNDGKAEDSSNT